jgi:hypothetical protein
LLVQTYASQAHGLNLFNNFGLQHKVLFVVAIWQFRRLALQELDLALMTASFAAVTPFSPSVQMVTLLLSPITSTTFTSGGSSHDYM